jgi:hypothetical protein
MAIDSLIFHRGRNDKEWLERSIKEWLEKHPIFRGNPFGS